MNVTDQLINIALLGTAIRELIATDLPEELQDSLRDIQEKAEDAETAFYQLSALGFAFRRAGLKAYLLKDPVSVSEAPEESKACFSREVGELLTSCIVTGTHISYYMHIVKR